MASEFTVGVEEEYQLVDAESGALHSRAREVLATSWSGELRPELQDTTIEIGTRICASAAELDRELRRLRFEAATTAAAEDLTIVAAGTHPFSRWEEHHLVPLGRYAMIVERYRRIALDEHNFGMHVHVGIPGGFDRIVLLNAVRGYIPHLIALAASSPFYEGEDSGFASYRMVLWRRWPNAGMPPRLASSQEFRSYIEFLLRTDAISDERGLYWAVRPHSLYPTLEFRVTDICPRVDDAVAIAAFIRALVVAAATGRLEEPRRGPFSEGAEHALLGNNEWLATRFGLDGWIVDPMLEAGRMPMRSAIRHLLDRIHPTAEELGDGDALARIEQILDRGNGAEHMRRLAGEGGLDAVAHWLIGETLLGTGLDRRRAQRASPPTGSNGTRPIPSSGDWNPDLADAGGLRRL